MTAASEQTVPSLDVVALLESSQASAWPQLHINLSEAQSEWHRALTETSPQMATEWHDGDWSALELASHMVNWMRLVSSALANVCVSEEAALGNENFLPGNPALARVLQEHERWADELRMATTTVAKLPERGPVIGSGIGPLTARQVVGLTIAHLGEHAMQLRSMRKGGGRP